MTRRPLLALAALALITAPVMMAPGNDEPTTTTTTTSTTTTTEQPTTETSAPADTTPDPAPTTTAPPPSTSVPGPVADPIPVPHPPVDRCWDPDGDGVGLSMLTQSPCFTNADAERWTRTVWLIMHTYGVSEAEANTNLVNLLRNLGLLTT